MFSFVSPNVDWPFIQDQMLHPPNVDSRTALPEDHDGTRFLPAQWTMNMLAVPETGGGIHCVADLYREGALVCRIALSGTFSCIGSAEDALWKRLRTWLDEYETRPHSGDSGFTVL